MHVCQWERKSRPLSSLGKAEGSRVQAGDSSSLTLRQNDNGRHIAACMYANGNVNHALCHPEAKPKDLACKREILPRLRFVRMTVPHGGACDGGHSLNKLRTFFLIFGYVLRKGLARGKMYPYICILLSETLAHPAPRNRKKGKDGEDFVFAAGRRGA